MARIRSVHPGLFTDESFVELSDAAKIFFIGLWTEADDFGAFEWKPTTLRMKLRPASDGGVESLLEELVSAKRIIKYEHDGRHYGLIRNFTKYQRPKFPKSLYFIPLDFRNFVGSSGPPTEKSRDERGPPTEKEGDERRPFPRKGEKSPQMEDGGRLSSQVSEVPLARVEPLSRAGGWS